VCVLVCSRSQCHVGVSLRYKKLIRKNPFLQAKTFSGFSILTHTQAQLSIGIVEFVLSLSDSSRPILDESNMDVCC